MDYLISRGKSDGRDVAVGLPTTNECLGRGLTRMFGLPMDNCLILVPLLNSCSIVS